MFEGLRITDHAKTAQHEIAEHLRKQGFSVELEVPLEFDGRNGRIDIVAKSEDRCLVIEVDRSSPRKKSFTKVLKYKAIRPEAEPYILLRGEREPYTDNGVTIIGVKICR